MKKLIAILLVVSVLFTFASCGGNKTEGNINNNNVVENNDNQENIENNDVADNKQDIPDDLTADFVKSYPVTNASQFEVSETPNGIAISSYTGSDEIVVIPEEINGKPVIEIQTRAFAMCDSLKAIKLSNSIKEIGDEAFLSCGNLEVFVCGTSLESIGDICFGACFSLKELDLNEGLKTIKTAAIPKSSIDELYIPNSVVEIDETIGNDGLKIICEAGSVAEQHAVQNGYTYEIR